MPKITVDVSQAQPAQGIPAEPVSKHPSIPEMPKALGNIKAGAPVPQNDAEQVARHGGASQADRLGDHLAAGVS